MTTLGEHAPREEEASTLQEASQPLVSAIDKESEVDAKVDSTGPEAAKDAESSRPSMFNWGERPIQDANFRIAFLVGMAILAIRELAVFFWPVLGLRLFDFSISSSFAIFSVFVGLLVSIPGCFFLLWATKDIRSVVVKGFLVLVFVVFLLSSVLAMVDSGPNPGTSEGPEPEFQATESGSSSLPASSAASSESALLQAAMPGSVARILLGAASSGTGRHALSGTPPGVVRRGLQMLHHHVGGSIQQRSRLLRAEHVLTHALNAAAVAVLLFYFERFFSLTAVILSDASKFVLTKGRGLVFVVVAVISVAVGVSLVPISAAVQVTLSCPGMGIPPLTSEAQLCNQWTKALASDPLTGSPLVGLGLFLALWLAFQLQLMMEFMAAHVVGQCYGNMRTSMEEDDAHLIVRAAKCAMNESLGTLCLASLLSAGVTAASFLLNLGMMALFGDSVFAALPLVVNSTLVFAFHQTLACFLLPIVAVTGQSFWDAARTTVALLRANLVPAVAVTLSALCVIGALLALIILGSTIAGVIYSLLFSLFLAPAVSVHHLADVVGMFVLIPMLMTFATCVTIFHWVLGSSVSSTLACLVLDGKANQDLASTPLALVES